jgi:hypothetical protein
MAQTRVTGIGSICGMRASQLLGWVFVFALQLIARILSVIVRGFRALQWLRRGHIDDMHRAWG